MCDIPKDISDLEQEKMYEVLDKATGKIVCRNRIINQKVMLNAGKLLETPLVSFDNRFYWFLRSSRYVIRASNLSEIIIFTNSDDFNVCTWMKFHELYPSMKIIRKILIMFGKHSSFIHDVDIIREKDITELDDEIKDIVKILNSIPGLRTTSSCSGHGKTHAYVDIEFSSLSVLYMLCELISNDVYLSSSFMLSTDEALLYTKYTTSPMLMLKSRFVGKRVFEDIKVLTDKLRDRYSSLM